MNSKVIITLCSIFLSVQALRNLDVIEKNFQGNAIKSEALIKTYNADGSTFRRYCGGAVVHPRFIISEFTCNNESPKYDLAIGSDKITEDGNTKWIQSDCYIGAIDLEYLVKIAFFVFNDPINNGNVEIAKLPPSGSDIVAKDTVYVAAYGTYGVEQLVPELDLQISEGTAEDRRKCVQRYEGLVNEMVICYYDDQDDEKPRLNVDFASPVYKDNETVIGVEFYRDAKECIDIRPVLSYRFGNARLQKFINSVISYTTCKKNTIDSIQSELQHGQHILYH